MLLNIHIQDITNKWSEVKQLVPHRDSTLQQEMMRQQNNERLRRQFAAKANVVGQWIENQLDGVASIGVTGRSSLEEQLKKLQQFDKAVIAYKPNIDELERYNQVQHFLSTFVYLSYVLHSYCTHVTCYANNCCSSVG